MIFNRSSIFLFGYVNFVLPLLLYVEAIGEAENFENNYKQSAILDFENFICLKNQEICYSENRNDKNENQDCDYEHDYERDQLISQADPFKENIQNIFKEIQVKLFHKGNEIDSDTKNRVIDLLYELEGYYSLYTSYYILFGTVTLTKKKISMLFYSIILFLLLFMIFSIYFALYNFFINKTLVVNIFLQIK